MNLSSSARNILTSLLVTLGSQIAFASVPPMAVRDTQCIQDPRDTFDLGWRIAPEAVHVPHLCLDSSLVRPAKILEENETRTEFANFLHQGRYWIAQVQPNDVSSVALMSKRIANDVQFVNVIHLQTRFYFRHGIQLLDPVTRAPGPVLRSAVVSWEPAFPVGMKYEYMTTFFRNYPIVGRIISVDEPMAAELAGALPQAAADVKELALPLAADVAWRLFQNHLHLSQERQMSLAYILLRRNCATTFFDVLDVTLEQFRWPHRGSKFRTGLSLDPIYGPTIQALKIRHLIEGN
jgi:hypothetical protein